MRYDIRIFFPLFSGFPSTADFPFAFFTRTGLYCVFSDIGIGKKSFLILGAGCGSFDSQPFRYLCFFFFFFFLIQLGGFLCFHNSPLLSLVSDRFMNSSRKIPVVLVFVLGFGRAAPDNQ